MSLTRATLTDSRANCSDAVLDAIDRLQLRIGATELARRDIVAEVHATGVGFARQTVYRCIRRLSGQEPGSAHRDLDDLGDGRLRLRARQRRLTPSA